MTRSEKEELKGKDERNKWKKVKKKKHEEKSETIKKSETKVDERERVRGKTKSKRKAQREKKYNKKIEERMKRKNKGLKKKYCSPQSCRITKDGYFASPGIAPIGSLRRGSNCGARVAAIPRRLVLVEMMTLA